MFYSTNWVLTRLLSLSFFLSFHVLAIEPFDKDVDGRLFSVQGSNTVGASLMKNLLVGYFEAKGAADVSVTPLALENEYRVAGRVAGGSIYVDVAAHGSSTGFKALLAGNADLSMSSRPIKSKEVSALSDQGDMLGFDAENVIAIDGLAVIVHKDNPVTQLTIDQIASIFSGEISNWKQVGGVDSAISLYARDDKSGTWDTFKSLVLRKVHQLSAGARRFESNDRLSDLVSSDSGAIGFVGLASVRDSRALLVADAGTTALLPEKVSVATEDYVLSRRLFLYTPPRLKTQAIEDFVSFVQTDEGQVQVERTGFISQALIAIRPEADREGPAEYLALTESASRLSVNFRFAQGSASLDNKAQQDLQRLVAYMKHSGNESKKLTLVGFGDEKQTQSRSLVLSKLRAVALKSALHKNGVSTQPVKGFGAFMPVAANDGKSKLKNRRVEVWVH